MYVDPNCWDRVNSFALVSYIPEPISGFLDRLRQELVPNCFLRAHITILPPRPVASPHAAWDCIRAIAPHFPPLEVEMTSLQVFHVSDVIYIGIGAGMEQLQQMHAVLNADCLAFEEPFKYHPHITLAQELKPDELDELTRVARERWAAFPHERTFRLDRVVFVQNTRRNRWIDLGECALGLDESRLVSELSDTLVG